MSSALNIHITRRKLLRLGIVLSGGAALGMIGCKDKKEEKVTDKKDKKTVSKRPPPRQFPKDKFWLHSKTKILHYPVLYASRENFIDKNFTTVPIENWEAMLDANEAQFTKQYSGVIFEYFALKGLTATDDASIAKSTSIVARSFSLNYARVNQFNRRNYELLHQLIALNNNIAPENKWSSFTEMVKEVDMSKLKGGKQMAWIKSQADYDARTKYLLDKKQDYITRLNKRKEKLV